MECKTGPRRTVSLTSSHQFSTLLARLEAENFFSLNGTVSSSESIAIMENKYQVRGIRSWSPSLEIWPAAQDSPTGSRLVMYA